MNLNKSHLVHPAPPLPLLPGLLQPDLSDNAHQQLVDVVVDPCFQTESWTPYKSLTRGGLDVLDIVLDGQLFPNCSLHLPRPDCQMRYSW